MWLSTFHLRKEADPAFEMLCSLEKCMAGKAQELNKAKSYTTIV
jgi:hypothetical protein